MNRTRLLPGIAVALTVLSLAASPAFAGEVSLRFLNGTYTELDSGLEPLNEGPLTIHLSAPEHRLIVHSNRVVLSPIADGRFAAAIEIDLEGEGQLVAEVRGAGVKRRFTDRVAAPRQTVKASGEILLERVEGGFAFTVERPGTPAFFEIESGVAQQIVGVCRAVALIPFLDVGCDRLERGLSILRIPMPEPGSRFFLSDESLSKKERKFFNKLLSSG